MLSLDLKPNPNVTPTFMVWQSTPLMLYLFTMYQILVTNSKFWYILFIGMITGEFINHSLKQIIGKLWKDDYPNIVLRPSCKYACNYIGLQSKCSGLGMPSGHSQATAIFVTMLYLYFQQNDQLTTTKKIILLIILLAIPLSRVYYQCHSFAQIILGSMVGIFIGFILFKIYTL